MGIKLYLSRTSGNRMMRLQQAYIRRVFKMKAITFEEVDIADPMYRKDKEYMQQTLRLDEATGASEPLPPQIFKDREHKGDFESFFKAVEREELYRYLGLAVPPQEVEATKTVLIAKH